MKNRLAVMAAIALLTSLGNASVAKAWNCSDPLASRVDVGSTKPTGTMGDGDGQWYKGTDAANPNDYYVCQKPTTPPAPTSSSQSQNQSQSNAANSSSASNSNATGGNATATGGNSSSKSGVSNSGNSSSSSQGGSVNGSGNSSVGPVTATGGKVSNSGNSSNTNTNTNTANGGTGGQGGQGGTASSTSSATGGAGGSASSSNNSTGSGNSTSVNESTVVEAPKIPVATAFAPTAIPTVPCFKGFGVGVQTQMVGASFGGGKVDAGCNSREMARYYALLGSRKAACKELVHTKSSKQAGVTMADCMEDILAQAPQPVPVVIPTPPVQPTVIILQQPAPVTQTIVPVASLPDMVVTPSRHLLGICTFASNVTCQRPGKPDEVQPLKTIDVYKPTRVTSICKSMLEEAFQELSTNPKLKLYVDGNANQTESVIVATTRANNVRTYLVGRGIASNRIFTSVGNGSDRTVELWVGQE